MNNKEKANLIVTILNKIYPKTPIPLKHRNKFTVTDVPSALTKILIWRVSTRKSSPSSSTAHAVDNPAPQNTALHIAANIQALGLGHLLMRICNIYSLSTSVTSHISITLLTASDTNRHLSIDRVGCDGD